MELRHLRYFAALVEQLSFTNAAAKVHVTQSTLSHQIKQLEDELGHRLFDRVGKRVTLTEVGETFHEHVQSALGAVEAGVWAVRKNTDVLNGSLRIGSMPSFNLRIVPACISTFMEQNRSVFVTVLEMSADRIFDRLLAGELDVGVAYQPENKIGLHFEPLYNEQLVLAVGAHHAFARRRVVRMVELHLRRLVLFPRTFATRILLERCFETANAHPLVALEMDAISPMLEVVRTADIAAIVPEHATARDDVFSIPLERPTPIRTPGLLWRTDRPRTPATRRICSLIQIAVNQNKVWSAHTKTNAIPKITK